MFSTFYFVFFFVQILAMAQQEAELILQAVHAHPGEPLANFTQRRLRRLRDIRALQNPQGARIPVRSRSTHITLGTLFCLSPLSVTQSDCLQMCFQTL